MLLLVVSCLVVCLFVVGWLVGLCLVVSLFRCCLGVLGCVVLFVCLFGCVVVWLFGCLG